MSDQEPRPRRKVGRPHKGDRYRLTIRVPRALANEIAATARARGITLNDAAVELVELGFGNLATKKSA